MKPEVAKVVAGAEIIPRLAPSHGPEDGDAIPDDIVGAQILGFGTIAWDLLEEVSSPIEAAGLVVDYLPHGSDSPRRVSFGASELGVWVAFQSDSLGPRTHAPSRDCAEL
jgi:hypothetical protein